MKFRPLHDRVLIRRVEAEEKTAGGIIIPDTAKEKPQEGEVIAVGPGTLNDRGELRPLDVKAGDRILFGKWSGTEVRLEGEELLIMKESASWACLEAPRAYSGRRRDPRIPRAGRTRTTGTWQRRTSGRANARERMTEEHRCSRSVDILARRG
jgi:chaperonin GroES